MSERASTSKKALSTSTSSLTSMSNHSKTRHSKDQSNDSKLTSENLDNSQLNNSLNTSQRRKSLNSNYHKDSSKSTVNTTNNNNTTLSSTSSSTSFTSNLIIKKEHKSKTKKLKNKQRKKLKRNLKETDLLTRTTTSIINNKNTNKRTAKSKAIQAISNLTTPSSKIDQQISKHNTNSKSIDLEESKNDSDDQEEELDFEEEGEEEEEEEENLDEKNESDQEIDLEEEFDQEQDVKIDKETQEDQKVEIEGKNKKQNKRRKSSFNTRSRRSSRTSNNSNLIDSDQESENYTSRLRRQSASSSTKSYSKLTDSSLAVPVKKARLSVSQRKSTDSDKSKKTNIKTYSFSSTSSDSSSSASSSTSSKSNTKQNKETGGCISKQTNQTSTTSASLLTNTQQQTSSRRSAPASTSSQQLAAATNSNSTNQRTTSIADSSPSATSFFSKFKSQSKTTEMNQDQSNKQTNENNTTNTNNNNSAKPTQTTSAPSSSGFGLIESAESSDNDNTADFSRLTDLLQSRGLPTHIVNAFGSKVQQFIHRTMSSGISGRFQSLISSLQQPDESIKLTALTELCQLLVMGNEDTLVGFPIKQAVPILLQCMSSESENFDLMNHACRTLTYMMESLPRSTSIIAEGISVFLEKLQVIQCMDVAEQSLTALEILSRRHSKQILNATQSGSVSACLTYIDFFSITAQRNALQITANCCQNMIKEEFVNIQASLPILSQRLTHSDKKSVESVCTVFARLVENFQRDSSILKEIASHNVLENMQQLLVIQPSVVSSSMFVTILHTIYLMCSNCNELCVNLIESNLNNTLKFLLIGNKTINQKPIEILSTRSPQELYEIVCIIGEIMPRLPLDGIFSIDETLRKASIAHQNEHVMWQWKDENEVLRPYTPIDSRIIEAAYIQEEDECILNTMGRTYIIDFNSMLQINEETGTARPVTRKVLSGSNENLEKSDKAKSANINEIEKDYRLDYLNKKPEVYSEFIYSLFNIVYEVYSSSAGPAIKHRSLRTLLRMIYFASSLQIKKDLNLKTDLSNNDSNNNKTEDKSNNLLYHLLRDLPISSHIASMLASQDTKIIVSALQLCDILMTNLPDIFTIYFHREGVIYQIDKLIESSELQQQQSASFQVTSSKSQTEIETSDKNQSIINTDQQTQRKTRSATQSSASAQLTGSTTSSIPIQDASKRKAKTSATSKNTSVSSLITRNSSKISTNQTQSNQRAEEPFSLSSQGASSISSTNQTKSKYLKNIFKMNTNSSTGSRPSQTSINTQKDNTGSSRSSQPASSFFMGNSNKSSTAVPQQPSTEFSIFGSNSRWGHFRSGASAQLTSAPNSSLYQPFSSSLNTSSLLLNSNPSRSIGTGRQKSKSESQKSIDFNLINLNKELVRRWILDQAKKFKKTYFDLVSSKKLEKCDDKSNVLERLVKSSLGLNLNESNNNNYIETLTQISDILKKTDISSFEMIHSNLIDKFIQFITLSDSNTTFKFDQSKLKNVKPIYLNDLKFVLNNELNVLRVKLFLSVFSNLPLTYFDLSNQSNIDINKSVFSMFVSKLHNCVNQLEQFAVRVHDVPNSIGSGKNAIKFFTTHQLKCMLQRHPSIGSSTPPSKSSENTLRQWKGGHVKVDPLALVGTIEKYLLMRGIHKPSPVSITASSANSGTTGTFLSTSLPSSSVFGKKQEAKSKKAVRQITETSTAATSSSSSTTLIADTKNAKINKKNATKSKQSKTKETSRKKKELSSKILETKIDEDDEDGLDLEQEEDEDVDIGNDDFEDQLVDQALGENDENEEEMDEDNEEDEDEEEMDDRAYDDEDNSHIIEGEDEEHDDDEDLIDEDEDEDDDDIESAMSAFLGSSSSSRFSSLSTSASRGFFSTFGSTSTHYPKLELLINDHVLPSNMTIYQAIKQFSSNTTRSNIDLDNENDIETSLLNNAIWSKVHLIHYRLAETSNSSTQSTEESSKRNLRNSKDAKDSKKEIQANNKTIESTQTIANLNNDIKCTHFYNNLNNNNLQKKDSIQTDKSIESIYLLNLLNNLNRNWFQMYQETSNFDTLYLITCQAGSDSKSQCLINTAEFVNTKLTAKVNRQLQDPLIIMTGHLPKWLPELINSCQFLFPFETRLMHFYISSLDRDRAMQKLIDLNSDILLTSQNERFKPKLERKKRTISRSNDLIKQADSIISEFSINTTASASTSTSSSLSSSSKPALLEIQYENEVGTGLGPTLEFYALVSQEIQKCEHEMWRGDKMKLNTATGQNKDELFFYSSSGLFPSPINTYGKQTSKQQTHVNKIKNKFKFLGKFMAKSVQDFRVLDLQLSQTFYKWLLEPSIICDEDIKYVDQQLYKSIDHLKNYLRKRRSILLVSYKSSDNQSSLEAELKLLEKEVSDLDLDFTLPGYSTIELKKGGKDLIVNLENLDEYIKLIIEWTLIKGVQTQMESFKEGFESIMPISCLRQFYPEELERLFCGSGYNKWDSKTLIECTRCDHGYTHESKAVQYLFEIMSDFSSDEQRLFLQFVTGSPRLPVGGLRSLVPQLTIVKKTMDTSNANPDNYLPSVMTCVNYLKLPEYTSVNILKEKLTKAMKDGQLSFHLS